jgi:branched-chain amino acid transport system ATP-binding protein
MKALLEVRSLRKAFGGVRAVDDVSFTVGEGELLALIGPNGAGKSTCFNMVNGQLAADGGDIRLAGESIVGLGPRQIWKRGVGRTFQVAAIWGSLTVCENVQMALLSHAGEVFRFWRPVAARHREEALALLADVGMQAQAQRPARELAR